jgi:hypothetical protein
MRTKEFDKIVGSDFERAKRGPKGVGQEPGVQNRRERF